MNKYVKWIIYGVIAVSGAACGTLVAKHALEEAHKKGMKDYHGMCIGLPGARVDKEDGTVVECYGVGRLTPHELQQLQEVER